MIKFKFVLTTKKACFIFIILFIFVSGCSTTPYLIKDEETLKALKIDDQDGFLVARIYTEFLNINFSNPYHQNQFGLKMLQSVFFSFVAEGGKGFGSDKQELKKLGDWEPLVIIKAPAKKYQWEHFFNPVG